MLAGLTFSNFQYTLAAGGHPADSSVSVSTVNDGTNVGFIFAGAFSAGPGVYSDVGLQYVISSTTANIVGDTVALLAYGASGPGASTGIVEGICTTARTSSGQCIPSSKAYTISAYDNADTPPPVQSASVIFTSATNYVAVNKDIIATGGTGDGFAVISQFENTVQISGGGGTGGGPVPEPASMFTLGSGLLATAFLLRKKLKRS